MEGGAWLRDGGTEEGLPARGRAVASGIHRDLRVAGLHAELGSPGCRGKWAGAIAGGVRRVVLANMEGEEAGRI